MPRLTTLLRAAAVTALSASLLAVAPAAPAVPAGPAVGDCHRLTQQETLAASDSDPAVDCGTTHNALTVKVVTVAADTDWGDGDAVWNKVGTSCYRGLDATLGRTARARERSAYGLVWFIPTAQQRADGARWVRCDAVLWGRPSLRPIPDASPLLEQPLTDRVARCLTGKPYYTVGCAQKHAFRATGLARLKFGSYPSDRVAQRFAERQCPSRVSSARWRYTYPNKTAWKAGRHYLVCYTKTSA